MGTRPGRLAGVQCASWQFDQWLVDGDSVVLNQADPLRFHQRQDHHRAGMANHLSSFDQAGAQGAGDPGDRETGRLEDQLFGLGHVVGSDLRVWMDARGPAMATPSAEFLA